MLRLNRNVWSNLRILLIVWERKTGEVRGCSFRLKRTKLNYRKFLLEVNAGKVERAIEKTALYAESGDYILENLSENKEKLFVG